MELLLSISNITNLSKAKSHICDGLIFGSAFSLRFDYSIEEMKKINYYCHLNNIKRYIAVDAFIFEEDRVALYDYFEFLKELNPDGIYFTDLGIISVALRFGLSDKLIYDPDTLMTNSLDAAFYLSKGIGVTLARELNMDEIVKIVRNNPNKVDIQVFGHQKLSYSKRRFLHNYFRYLGEEKDFSGNRHLSLVEETRDFSLPVVEDKYGTRIYSDYVLLMLKECVLLKPYVKRMIVDDFLIEDPSLLLDVLRDIRRCSFENAAFLSDSLIEKYPDQHFDTGYLYQKITKTKNENE